MFILTHPHQDPSRAVLDVLELLKTAARDPDEECVAVIQPGGDKGMDKLFCSFLGEHSTDFGDVPKMIE